MLVEGNGADVLGKFSDVIAPDGCCAGYEGNYDKSHDTRDPSESSTDTEKNNERITKADLTK